MSAARPKIADYPFTTLVPNLGVIRSGDTVYTMADVPGLIPGASTGKGLGVQFLRHVERCAVLVHVVDMATMEPGRDPESDIEALEHELAEYGGDELDLVGRLRIAVLNKIDVPDARELVDLVRASLEKRGLDVYPVSAATGEGLTEFGFALGRGRRGAPRQPAADGAGAGHRHARRPSTTAASPSSATPRTTERLRRPRRPARALGAADRLHQRRGRRLPRRPAQPARRRGASWPRPAPARATRSPIGGVTFDWVPTLPAGTLTVGGVRGPGRPRHRRAHRRAAPRPRRGAAGGQEGAPDALRAQRRDLDATTTSRPDVT